MMGDVVSYHYQMLAVRRNVIAYYLVCFYNMLVLFFLDNLISLSL